MSARRVCWPAFALLSFATACTLAPRTTAPIAVPALRVSESAQEGDARRRASTQLVLDGLASDASGNARGAVAHYEDALKLDANNPFAALALARSEIFGGDVDRGLAYLDRFESLAGSRDGAAAHIAGLRGAALLRLGKRTHALPNLEEARSLSPSVWGDARLDARELR
jgi:tetratricopeptide (TPR) repeat protein